MNHISRFDLDLCFHNIARVHIKTNHPDVNSFFAREYSYHLTDGSSISTDLPLIQLDFSLNSKIPPGYIRHTHKFLAHWAYRMEISSNLAKISVVGNKFSIPMVHHMMLHPMLRYFASRQGVLMLHSGVVSLTGKSVIFTGRGGAGKTTTTSLVLASDENWRLHADDYVFLKEGPVSLTYQTNLHVYQNLISLLPEIAEHLTLWELVKLKVFGLIRQWSNEGIKWPVRLPVNRIWLHRQIENSAVPVAIIQLEQSDVNSGLHKIENIQNMGNTLLEMNFYEARHFIQLLQKGESVGDDFLTDWKQSESNILHKLLQQIPAYSLRLPSQNKQSYTQEKVLEVVKDLVTPEKN